MYMVVTFAVTGVIAVIGIVFAVKLARLHKRQAIELDKQKQDEKIEVLERENYFLQTTVRQLKARVTELEASPLEREVNAWKTKSQV